MRSVQREVLVEKQASLCVWISFEAGSDAASCSDQRCVWEKLASTPRGEKGRRGGPRKSSVDMLSRQRPLSVCKQSMCHRLPRPCLHARSGLAPATTFVLRPSLHAKFYGRGVFFVWLVVLCTLLIDCQPQRRVRSVLPHVRYTVHTCTHTHTQTTLLSGCAVFDFQHCQDVNQSGLWVCTTKVLNILLMLKSILPQKTLSSDLVAYNRHYNMFNLVTTN